MRHLPFILVIVGLLGCGKKWPIPPRTQEGLPPESSYVSVEVWDDFTEAADILLGGDGFIYLIDGSDVLKLQLNKTEIDADFGGIQDPVHLGFGMNRTVYVAEGAPGDVKVFDTDGVLLETFEDTLFASVAGIALDEAMNLYLSDSLEDVVLRYDSSGTFVDTISKRGEGNLFVEDPLGLAISEERELIFVVSRGHNWVEGLTLESPIANAIHLGGDSHDGDTAEGYFRDPLDVAVDGDGNIFVADYSNERVQKFRSSGEFATAFRSRKWSDQESRPKSVASSTDGSTIYVVLEDEDGRSWVEIFELAPIPEEPQ
jgi:DNA-binding beta-propeller fold protein YncE